MNIWLQERLYKHKPYVLMLTASLLVSIIRQSVCHVLLDKSARLCIVDIVNAAYLEGLRSNEMLAF